MFKNIESFFKMFVFFFNLHTDNTECDQCYNTQHKYNAPVVDLREMMVGSPLLEIFVLFILY